MVAKTSNLTQAAKQLFTTAPAVSAHIKALETELNTSLFIRSSKGMTLTEKGKLLLIHAQKTLDCVAELSHVAAANQDYIKGHFKLACNQSPSQLKIEPLLNNLNIGNLDINLIISSMPTGQIISAIRDGNSDGGYIYGAVPDDFEAIFIAQQRITTIAPASLYIPTPLPPDYFITQSWVTMGEDCPFDQQLANVLGNNIRTVTSSNDDKSRLELVKAGIGLSYLAQQEAIEHAQQGEITILNQLDFELHLHFVIAKNRRKDPVIDAIFQRVKIIWKN
ncbi:MAG: LysR family transcriptional regulator [Gammaproteobacteria bacterium]|nr:LysR family transcriptional regulator [Gammaproteobacteria bacterium]